jgi:D-lactate dehydrogenase (cytochrome)
MPGKPTMRRDPEGTQSAIAELAAHFANRLVISRAVCEQHANSETWLPAAPPDAVLYVRSTEDVQHAVSVCGRHAVPIIPFGTGTSFEGGVNAPLGGICIDFKEMNRILAVHAEDFDCVVEPGVTRMRLNEHLRDQGLFFSVDPGADASLGGMASTRASGTNTVRYGTMKDNVLGLSVVLADGRLISTARRARKSSAGYDLTRLFVGAEGTLGLITGLTLKLHGIPEAVAAGICSFPSVEAACGAGIAAIQAGIPLARIELLDEVQIRACNGAGRLALPEMPTLFVEFHGSDHGVTEQSERFGEIAADFAAGPFEWATRPEERSRLWEARHHAFWAVRSLRPGAHVVVTDVCVPISRLAECVTQTKADIARSGLIAPILGHVGDGNFHACVLVMMDDPHDIARAKSFIERTSERALAMEGTCTGEHGIGQGKKAFLVREHGAGAVDSMKAIKQALDPQGLLNPGKVL